MSSDPSDIPQVVLSIDTTSLSSLDEAVRVIQSLQKQARAATLRPAKRKSVGKRTKRGPNEEGIALNNVLVGSPPVGSPPTGRARKANAHVVPSNQRDREPKGAIVISADGAPWPFREVPPYVKHLSDFIPFSHWSVDAAGNVFYGDPKSKTTEQQDGWSKPRQKLFLFPPPPQTAAEQGHKCYGCGADISEGLFKATPRLCNYFMRYFCVNCHDNDQTSVIPALLLRDFDTRTYNVSALAHTFLKSIFNEPVFDIATINPDLPSRVPRLQEIKQARQHIQCIRDFVRSCPLEGGKLFSKFFAARTHLIDELERFSLRDLIDAGTGELSRFLASAKDSVIFHVSECADCQSRGSVCSLCKKNRVLFPFEIFTTTRCYACRTLYHKACFDQVGCRSCAGTASATASPAASPARPMDPAPANSAPMPTSAAADGGGAPGADAGAGDGEYDEYSYDEDDTPQAPSYGPRVLYI